MFKKLTIEITEFGNEAFCDGNYRTETARILRNAAEMIEKGLDSQMKLMDINGNSVGKLEIKHKK